MPSQLKTFSVIENALEQGHTSAALREAIGFVERMRTQPPPTRHDYSSVVQQIVANLAREPDSYPASYQGDDTVPTAPQAERDLDLRAEYMSSPEPADLSDVPWPSHLHRGNAWSVDVDEYAEMVDLMGRDLLRDRHLTPLWGVDGRPLKRKCG